MFSKRIYAVLAAALLGGMSTNAVWAGDLDVVKAFYSDLLSEASAADLSGRTKKVIVEDWVSIPTPRGGPGREGMVKTLAGFGAAIPDLKWNVQEILQDGNRYIVRSVATGTPVKEVFGVEPKGRSFEIMTIDIHTVENGLIVQSYHVEEWLKAKYQLAGPKE
ncbi:MAG: ester cyclase [Pseudomonadota bacterium]